MNELHIDKTHWKRTKIGDLLYKTEYNNKENASKQYSKFIKMEHLDANSLNIHRWGDSSVEDIPPTFYKIFKKGQILYPTRNPQLRRAALASFDGICGEKTLTLSLIEGCEGYIPFIAHVFHSSKFIEYATNARIGSTNPHIRWRDVADYEFLLPPKAEQKRLAELLWAADEVVEKEKRERDILQNQIQIYINENCNAIGQSKIPFSDLVDVNPTTKFDENEVSLITMPDVSEEGEIMHLEKVVPSDYKNKGLTPFQENDILFAKITPCMENGKGAIAKGLINGWGLGSTEFHVLRPKLASDLYFCYYLTMSKRFRKLAEKQMTGSAGQKRVQVEFFDFYKLCAPSIDERKIIGEKLFKMDCSISALKQQISLSQQIKQELINKVF